jgi:hypothetical protein
VADQAVTTDSTTPLLTASLTTAWAANANVKNSITANVNNGDSLVVALDHKFSAVEWLAPGTAGLNELELRERTECPVFAGSSGGTPCVPAFGFRVPVSAKTGEKWYAAMKATVAGATSNNLAVGVYYVAIIATVTAPVRHYTTWSALDTERTGMIAWRWTSTGMPTSTTLAANGGWTYQASAPAAGWQEDATPLNINVAPSQEVCFEFGNIDTTTLTKATVAAKTGATAYTASTGAEPTNTARVTGDQLQNAETALQTSAWCFTAPATGFAYINFKSGVNLYLPIKIDTASRPRIFRTSAEVKSDAGERFFGSIHRTYTDLSRQWATTPSTATPTINTDFVVDEVAVKRVSATSDLTNPVSKGVFAVYIEDAGFTKCTEYAATKMLDTKATPTQLARPTTWLSNWAVVSDTSDVARDVTTWAFSWQVPTTALDNDAYYVGLRCEGAGTTDFSAMWKVSVTEAPAFAETTAALQVGPGNQPVVFTLSSFQDKWVGSAANRPSLPDPKWDAPTAQLQAQAGHGFSVAINVVGVTDAIVVAEEDLLTAYGAPLNFESLTPILQGEVATKTAAVPASPGPVANAFWSPLPASTASAYPAFSWVLPSTAEVGQVLYTALRAKYDGTEYVALFEVTVTAPTMEAEAISEEKSLASQILSYTLYAAAAGVVLAVFVL